MMKSITVQAPVNIAIIKYMGKLSGNIPTNPSLSLTLNQLSSITQLLWDASDQKTGVVFESKLPSLANPFFTPMVFDLQEQNRLLNFVKDIIPEKILSTGLLTIRTANNFPAATGIASSASGFAALTTALVGLFEGPKCLDDPIRLARLSQKGSGSSCRSFLGPWVCWEKTTIYSLEKNSFEAMSHAVVLLENTKKSISSSVAHHRVKESSFWEARQGTVQKRYIKMLNAFAQKDWPSVVQSAFTEAIEMHSLFHTSYPFFSYWNQSVLDALRWVNTLLESQHDYPCLPLFTMDAGSNLHFIFPQSYEEFWRKELQQQFKGQTILYDQQGRGVQVLECQS